MTALRQWLLGVACTALVLAAAEGLAPKGSVKKVCRLAGGLALLLAAVGPLLRLDSGLIARAAEEYRAASQSCEEGLAEKSNLLYQTIIEDNTAAYIVDKAEELGLTCTARVTCEASEDGVYLPVRTEVTGLRTAGEQEKLIRVIERDLGVPAERQFYAEEEEKP